MSHATPPPDEVQGIIDGLTGRVRVLSYLRNSLAYRNTLAEHKRAEAQLLAGLMCEVAPESHAEVELKQRIAHCLAERQQQEAISSLLEDALSLIEVPR